MNDANAILPAGDVQLGRYDYNIYTNALLGGPSDVAQVPLKMVGQSPAPAPGDAGVAKDSFALQYNIVRVERAEGGVSAYLQTGRRFQYDSDR